MIVIALKFGQLGNRLTLFAHFIAFSKEYGVPIINAAFDDYATEFLTTSRDPLCRFPARTWPGPITPKMRRAAPRLCGALIQRAARRLKPLMSVVRLPDDHTLDIADPAFVRQSRGKIVFVQGWLFRNEGLVQKHAAAIRDYFRPIEKREAEIRQTIQSARADTDVLIGVHMRCGDYRVYEGGRFYYELPRYCDVMRRAAQMFPNQRVKFLICSDEKQDPAQMAPLTVTFGPGSIVGDMYALGECDYIMGPPSTFTTWASFYGQKPLYKIVEPEAEITLEDFYVRESVGHHLD